MYDAVDVPKGERKYLTFDSSKPPGPCVKSKLMTKELEFCDRYLTLTLTAYLW